MQTATDTARDTDPRPVADTTPSDTAAEVCLTGTFRAVNWITRTAQLYDEDGAITTVRFTPEQDGWMKLVANVPVKLKGTRTAADADASQNGQHASDADSDGVPEQECLHLSEVKVLQKQWFPYDDDDFESVREHYLYHPDTHQTLSFDFDVDEFMRSIRGPDYRGSEGP